MNCSLTLRAIQQRARFSLWHCCDYVHLRHLPERKAAPFHRFLCDSVEDFINSPDDDIMVINMPPGAAKTLFAARLLPAYILGIKPHWRVGIVANKFDLAEQSGGIIRNLVSSNEFSDLYPKTSLSKKSSSASDFLTETKGKTLQGGFVGIGITGAILGRRLELLVIDDPISGYEEASSNTQLQKLHHAYENNLLTRLVPGGKVVLICQRLARNDLAGYIFDKYALNPETRKVKILKLPMKCTDPLTDPLQREEGELLWPEYYTKSMLADARHDDFLWKTLYQQEPPSDSGSWVSNDELQMVDTTPDNLNYYIVSDLALSVNKGDFSVHLVLGVGEDFTIYIVDAWREQCDIAVTAKKHIELSQTYEPLESLIDDDNMAKVYIQLLASECREQKHKVPLKMMAMRGQDKEIRAAPLRGMFKRKKIFMLIADWNRWLIKEILTFPNAIGSGVDDGVDALGLIGRRLNSLAIASAPEPEPEPVDPRGSFYTASLDELHEERELTTRRAGGRW